MKCVLRVPSEKQLLGSVQHILIPDTFKMHSLCDLTEDGMGRKVNGAG